MTATESVDPELLRMEQEIERYRAVAEDAEDDETAEKFTTLVSDMNAPMLEYQEAEGDKPQVEIGYIPAALMTRIRHRVISLSKVEDIGEVLEAQAMLDRDVIKEGVKGWNLKLEDGTTAPIDTETVERFGWLSALARAIMKYNTLTDEEKKS